MKRISSLGDKRMVKPYDYTQLDEIVLFNGKRDIIELSREKQYINLIKPTEQDKRYYRYDLNNKKFQRINFYKTKDDKITDVSTKNITGWFTNSKIITKDLHFGRLILFAKFNHRFNKYKSPVRFIEQLGHKIITSIEQWEALGFKLKEMEGFFGPFLVNGNIDSRKTIYEGNEKLYEWSTYKKTYYQAITLAPSDFNKELLNYIKKNYTTLDDITLSRLHSSYNNGEYHIEKQLKEIEQDPEFYGIFHYKTTRCYPTRAERPERWSCRGRRHVQLSCRCQT